MATVLQPIVNELNSVLVQLRTELRGLQTDADSAGIAIYNVRHPKTLTLREESNFETQTLTTTS